LHASLHILCVVPEEAVRVITAVRAYLYSEVTSELATSTTVEDINACFRDAAQRPPLQGILAVSDDELVSVDIIGNPHSAIVDAPATMVLNGTMAKVLSWYDNEWGYACRLAELAGHLIAA